MVQCQEKTWNWEVMTGVHISLNSTNVDFVYTISVQAIICSRLVYTSSYGFETKPSATRTVRYGCEGIIVRAGGYVCKFEVFSEE